MAHEYFATVVWDRNGQTFPGNAYSRAHVWRFDGGVEVPASASPLVLPPRLSKLDAVDPEEALTAATSSCHMLFFLAMASKKGFVVDSYEDEAVATMGKAPNGRTGVVAIKLRPRIVFSGTKRPTDEDLLALHHAAHEACYIANSLTAEITVEDRH